MTTLQQTVKIPADHRLTLDLLVPQEIPVGMATFRIEWMKPPVKPKTPKTVALEPALEIALKDAREKRIYNQTHPAELRKSLKKLQEGAPLFGGIGADEFKRKSGNEWEDRIR